MIKTTAQDLVKAINGLPKNRQYYYPNTRTKTVIQIVNVVMPEGPVIIKRYNPEKGESPQGAKEESISSQMLWRVSNAFLPDYPINIDRVLGASYNTRSALEALLAHTPQFYMCYPGRIESVSFSNGVRDGHKHMMWCPNDPHELGVIKVKDTKIVISEIPSQEVLYDTLSLPPTCQEDNSLDIEVQRRHAQIQIALIMIGQHLNYKIWVAQNDKSIVYKGEKIGEMPNVLQTLNDGIVISDWRDAVKAALLIDCIWFKNGRLMPAVMEIEHTTGVTSGLTRMKKFQDLAPSLMSRYVVVASDEDREKVVTEANYPQFRSLNTRFLPYSGVEELWALCQRRKIQGITDEFLDSFMEPVLVTS